MNILKYTVYNINESTVSDFLKTQYQKIFPDATQSLNNLFNAFIKKIDIDRNISNFYQKFIKTNQTIIANEINKSESIDVVNKIITEEIKYFYFTLKLVVDKLQNDEFTFEKIFERSRDKRLMQLMSYPEEQFSNAVSEYTSTIAIPAIKDNSNINQEPDSNSETSTTERIIYKISKILEATEQDNLVAYKKSAINWVNTTLFDLIKQKMQILNKIGSNVTMVNSIDQLSKQMKGTNNDNAKKKILNKISNMNKTELEQLSNFIGIKKNELGQL